MFIIELLNTEGWQRFIGNRNVYTSEDAANYLLNGPMKSYEQHGFGLSCICIKETGEAIGMCGLIKRPQFQFPDIGFALLPSFEKKGYAYEAASCIIADARNRYEFEKMAAITNTDNDLSGSLLKKLGFVLEKEIEMDNEILNQYELNLKSTSKKIKPRGTVATLHLSRRNQ